MKRSLFSFLCVLSLLTLFIIFFSSLCNASAATVTKYDSYKDITIKLDEDLIVESGEWLVFNNVTLEINSTADRLYRIEVMDGGRLYINNSRISASDAYHPYIFWVDDGSDFQLINSELYDCGDPIYKNKKYYGLWVNSDDSIIKNNKITDCYIGIILDGCEHCIVERNMIIFNDEGILLDSSNNTLISGNIIDYNDGNGIYLYSSDKNYLMNNEASNNKNKGIWIAGSSDKNYLENNRFDHNSIGITVEFSKTNILKNNTVSMNSKDGIYITSFSHDNQILYNTAINNRDNGIYINSSNNSMLLNNNASYNGGYGFYIDESCDNIMAEKNMNVAGGNGKDDYYVPEKSLSFLEISFISIFFAFIDKIFFMIDLQKFIISNIFGGMAAPFRQQLSRYVLKPINKLISKLNIRRNEYYNAHINSRFNITFIHFLSGNRIFSIIRMRSPIKILSNPIALQQVRFFDLLLKDKEFLVRNVVYFGSMMLIGVSIYYALKFAGVWKLPYLIPIALQFVIMYFIGIIIEGNVIGKVENIQYDLGFEGDVQLLREDIDMNKRHLESKLINNEIDKDTYDLRSRDLNEQQYIVDYLEGRKHFLLFTEKGYLGAIGIYEKILARSPENPLALAGLSEAYAMLGQWKKENEEDGQEFIEKSALFSQIAYEIDNSYCEVCRAYAISLYNKGDRTRAEKEINNAIRINPSNAFSYYICGTFKDDTKEKLKFFKKALALNPDLIIAHRELGIIYLEDKKSNKAAGHFEKVIKLNDDDPCAHYYRGNIYQHMVRIEEAVREYKKALMIYPDYIKAKNAILKVQKESYQ